MERCVRKRSDVVERCCDHGLLNIISSGKLCSSVLEYSSSNEKELNVMGSEMHSDSYTLRIGLYITYGVVRH